VILVEQPVERSGTPSDFQHERGVDRSEHRPEELDFREMPALGFRDGRPSAAGLQRQVNLAPAEAVAQGPKDASDPLVVHGVTSSAPRLHCQYRRRPQLVDPARRKCTIRKVDVAVIGAGQAGLATSYFLSQRSIDYIVLDRATVGDSWRSRRWDSFTLNIPNWSFTLPGFAYDGPDPDGFMPKDEIVDLFTRYARTIEAPVETGIDVTRLARDDAGGYRLTTDDGGIQARAVVVATGAYQRHHVPGNKLDASVRQLSTDEYRNPSELNEGGVLVVGSGQSGCQIAEDLVDDHRRVWLATGSCGWIPRRYRGRDNVAWRMDMRIFDETVEQLGYETRRACPPIQTGVANGRELSLATLHDKGATLTGRFLKGEDTTVHLADDLQLNAKRSDEFCQKFLDRLDTYIRDAAIDAPPAPLFEPRFAELPAAPTELDLAAEGITNVIWSTGFRLDYSWIDLDLGLTEHGYPSQKQGVTAHPGLYFVGLQLMHTRKSGLIFGVGEDAEHIASAAAEHLGAPSGRSAPLPEAEVPPAQTAPGGSAPS
jgi:putative flavoprotein involved in K+ transport